MGTPQPIAWAEVASWSALAGRPLDALHARVLRLLDSAWIDAWHASQRPAAGARTS